LGLETRSSKLSNYCNIFVTKYWVWKYLVCDKGLRLPKSLLHVIDTVSFFNFRPAERVHGSSVAMNLDLTFSRQVSISPTFYMQLFCTKVFCTVFSANSLALYFFGKIILAQKLLAKCFWNWRQVSISQTCLRVAFTCADPKSAKKTVTSSVSFCAFVIFVCKNWS